MTRAANLISNRLIGVILRLEYYANETVFLSFLNFFKRHLTAVILRDMMYYEIGGILWTIN